jgi:hypothetical protein
MNLLLSVAQPDPSREWWKQVVPSKNEFGLLLAAVGVITFLALIWAIFIRKREDDSSRRYSYPHGGSRADSANHDSALAPQRKRRRKRRRRRRRNPTLAETGGLPPIRNDGYPGDPP